NKQQDFLFPQNSQLISLWPNPEFAFFRYVSRVFNSMVGSLQKKSFLGIEFFSIERSDIEKLIVEVFYITNKPTLSGVRFLWILSTFIGKLFPVPSFYRDRCNPFLSIGQKFPKLINIFRSRKTSCNSNDRTIF